jgi:TrmH family RNA methyltransferase
MSGLFFTKLCRGSREDILSVLSGSPIIVADMDGENVFTFQSPKQFTLVIGNEANGISKETEQAATHTVKIPMKETQESLNAAVSAGIIMYVLNQGEFLINN